MSEDPRLSAIMFTDMAGCAFTSFQPSQVVYMVLWKYHDNVRNDVDLKLIIGIYEVDVIKVHNKLNYENHEK